jgi:hypothetical protein
MTDGLLARAKAAGKQAVTKVVTKLADRLRDEAVGKVEAEADKVTVSGKGLWKSAALRWIAGLLK